MIAQAGTRVPDHTSARTQRRIDQMRDDSVAYHRKHPGEIPRRLRELDEEWDIERALEANAATLAFAGSVLGATVNRKWLFLPMAVTGFLLQHAVQGWCPPLPLLRRLGFRTVREIEAERDALRKIRADAS